METGGVAAVERALLILDSFRDSEAGLSLAELSKRTGLYKSTILRLIESLERFDYIRRVPDGTFAVGWKPFRLGAIYQRQFRLADHVRPALELLTIKLNESASFYVPEDGRRVCLYRVESSRSIRDTIREGDSLPLDTGAGGHVLMAFMGMPGDRYAEIRRTLVARSFGERDPETAAIAAPVFRMGRELAGALSLSGPRYRFEGEEARIMSAPLLEVARSLTMSLGGLVDIFDARLACPGNSGPP
jgi:DNA-binding IclR family transcriptional regulator